MTCPFGSKSWALPATLDLPARRGRSDLRVAKTSGVLPGGDLESNLAVRIRPLEFKLALFNC